MEIIQFIPCNLERQRILSYGECCLKLYENFIEYKLDFLCEEPINEDKELPWEERKEFNIQYVKKEMFVSIQLWYIQKSKVYKIEIEFNGLTQTINLFYRFKPDAEKYFQVLLNYFLNAS